jgi:hypothetical protein
VVDIVLGVSMAPSTVRMVLVEGENADGVTVDHDEFDVAAATVGSGPDQMIAAILGTRESAHEGGYQLTSTGVTFRDQGQATVLRDALAAHQVENVMLVSEFLAAAALAQAVGAATCWAATALLFIEPDTATLAVIDSADGSVAQVQHRSLASDDDTAVAELSGLVAGADLLEPGPEGLLVVGSGIDVAMIKPALDEATWLPVSTPEQPEIALARGAALASAHAPLFAASTQAMAWAQDLDAVPAEHPQDVDSRLLDFSAGESEPQRKPFLLAGSALATLFVVGVVTLVVALAVGMRSTAPDRPNAGGHVVAPHQQAPPPEAKLPAPPPQPKPQPAPAPKAPAPAPKAPAPQAPAPVHAPAPPAAAPAPPPPAMPPIIPGVPIPGLPGGPPVQGSPHGADGWDHHGGGHGHGGHGHGHQPKVKIPLPIPGVHLGVGF